MHTPIIFQCPKTGLSVQALFKQEPGDGEPVRHYEGLTCTACSRIHFINLRTGKLLGFEKP